MLLHFLDELQELIASYCHIVLKKRLACCNKKCYAVVKPLLWKCVAIPGQQLIKNDFTTDERVANLVYTDVLYLGSDISLSRRHSLSAVEDFLAGCRIVLKACNPKEIHCSMWPDGVFGDLVPWQISGIQTTVASDMQCWKR